MQQHNIKAGPGQRYVVRVTGQVIWQEVEESAREMDTDEEGIGSQLSAAHNTHLWLVSLLTDAAASLQYTKH